MTDIYGTTGDDTLTGTSGQDTLYGDEGNDLLDGLEDADTLVGGLGDDTYAADALDTLVELDGEGTDTVLSGVSHVLGDFIENLTLTGTADINATGNNLDNWLTGNDGSNILDGGAGYDMLMLSGQSSGYRFGSNGAGALFVDTVSVGFGRDYLSNLEAVGFTSSVWQLDTTMPGQAGVIGSAINDRLDFSLMQVAVSIQGGLGSDSLYGGTGNDSLYGGEGADVVHGGAGDDVLSGLENLSTSRDVLTGGSGNDTYLVDVRDEIFESAAGGTDTVMAGFSYTLGNEVENLVLTGLDAIDGIGNYLGNRLQGNGASNALAGLTGDDVYVIDALDLIFENPSEGMDTVEAGFSYTLADNFENLTLTGSANIDGTGNSAANILRGNGGVNVLTGGAGNDVYFLDAGDTAVELAGGGVDTVRVTFNYTLSTVIENAVAEGPVGLKLQGNYGNNSLTGGIGNDNLNGGGGDDTMVGGSGNDIYTVSQAGDTVIELAGGGWDRIYSSVSIVLPDQVEALTLTGTQALDTVGNLLANILDGNSAANNLSGLAGNDRLDGKGGNDLLDGGTGADTLTGGLGDDAYRVDQAGDLIVEYAGEGFDSVFSSISLTLAENVEVLLLSGSASLNATGNALNNMLFGNTGKNVLDGGVGNDSMAGGAGNDTYWVDASLDVVTENAGEGTDKVFSAVSYTLGANLEQLELTGAAGLLGSGNELANRLDGNSGDNTLSGGGSYDMLYGKAGNDVLEGGQGNDTLDGGAGNDSYVMRRGDSYDVIYDADSTPGNSDLLWFDDATISHSQLWLRQVGDDLEVAILGTGTRALIKGWYLSADNQLETIRAGDGEALLAADVDSLVSAMAAYGSRPAGATSLTTEEHAALDGIIAASWN